MINKVLQLIAPHHCYGCQKIGQTLCANCKYDIEEDGFDACIVCTRPSSAGICTTCHTTYDKAWCVGDRLGALERLIDAYKFERVKDACVPLVELLDSRLPVLPESVIIVPIPTVPKHIRQRGYDHAAMIAKQLAKRRSLPYQVLLERTDVTMQRGKNKKQRMQQAESAYRCNATLDPAAIYLLVDDVVTTNATIRFGADALRKAGATDVWVAVLARQPLDKGA